MPDQSPPSIQNDEIDLFELFQSLMQGWRWWVSGSVLGLLVAYGASQLITPLYEATTLIRIGQVGQVGQVEALPVTLERMKSDGFFNQLCAYRQCVENDKVLKKDRILVSQPRDAELIRLVVKAPSVNEAKQISQDALTVLAAEHQQIMAPSITQLKLRLEEAKNREAEYKAEREQVLKSLGQGRGDLANTYATLQLIEMSSQSMLANLRSVVMQHEAALQPPNTQPTAAIQATTVKNKPVQPKVALMVVLGFLMGGFVGLIGLLVRNVFRSRVVS